MFRFWWNKDRKSTFTKIRIEYCVDSQDVEHVVARSYREITSKKMLKEAIQQHLRDNGCDFNSENISYEQDEVKAAHEKARLVVKRFMPQLYAAAN